VRRNKDFCCRVNKVSEDVVMNNDVKKNRINHDYREAIVVEGLSKSYREIKALDNVSVTVLPGQTVGLLGENGAGKSTLIESILGLRKPDSGQINLLGHDVIDKPRSAQSLIGVQLQEMNLMPRITVHEHLKLFSGFYKNKFDLDELVEILGLKPWLKSKVGGLSGGWKQKVSIALALVNNPELLILDEPTTGFDPIARRSIWDLIRELKSQGRTILMSTHNMEEADALADVIVIISKGKIVASGTPEELKAMVSKENVSLDDVFYKLASGLL